MDVTYPPERTFTTRSGQAMRLRPIRPEDVPNLFAFHERLSRESLRMRYFTPRRRLTEDVARHLCTVDFRDRAAFVASPLESDAIHGIGRYERDAPHSAEVAFIVEDALQGNGIGPALLQRLAEHARAQGIERFTAAVLYENTAMLSVFRNSPFRPQISVEHDCAFVKLDLTVLPEPAAQRPAGRGLAAARLRSLQAPA
ncbi:GNAT family N-acetyltransferase [Tepidiforma flava]|uniref:GNAT family N-acetyltransferase n=1 Tax=Tepidiforma flava TaxID=3004094 RepID=A0ABY7M987_9CHLR|nr:GNAT family N-acetyltransferase [Tepidiforma flava]WBL36827.1 GNAT family N-acetyltransferase [Tepidiforma flava]